MIKLQMLGQIEQFLDLNIPHLISQDRFERPDAYSSLKRSVYQTIEKHGVLSSTQIADSMQLPIRSVRRYLKTLVQNNLVSREGRGPATVYRTTK